MIDEVEMRTGSRSYKDLNPECIASMRNLALLLRDKSNLDNEKSKCV